MFARKQPGMYWSYNKKPAPKPAAGATRKTYGNTWWCKQWPQTMDQIDEGNRLPRGKTYANKGLVKALEIQGNIITANVQGLIFNVQCSSGTTLYYWFWDRDGWPWLGRTAARAVRTWKDGLWGAGEVRDRRVLLDFYGAR